jgi:predicted RNA binding protein YcfA (HicA-like mRNA interferase family)
MPSGGWACGPGRVGRSRGDSCTRRSRGWATIPPIGGSPDWPDTASAGRSCIAPKSPRNPPPLNGAPRIAPKRPRPGLRALAAPVPPVLPHPARTVLRSPPCLKPADPLRWSKKEARFRPGLGKNRGSLRGAALGGALRSQRGSYQKLRHPDGRTAIIPLHPELAPGTLRSILRQSQLSLKEFQALL